MGKRASVHTFIAGVHASRCLTHLTRGCILPARKMFLDLSEPRRASDRIPSTLKMFMAYSEFAPFAGHAPPTGKMFLDLSRIHVSSRSHFVNLKNVHEPIWNSPCSGLHSLDPNNVLKTDMVFRRIAR